MNRLLLAYDLHHSFKNNNGGFYTYFIFLLYGFYLKFICLFSGSVEYYVGDSAFRGSLSFGLYYHRQ